MYINNIIKLIKGIKTLKIKKGKIFSKRGHLKKILKQIADSLKGFCYKINNNYSLKKK